MSVEQIALEVAREVYGEPHVDDVEFATRLLARIAETETPVAWMWVDADMGRKFSPFDFGVPTAYKEVAVKLFAHPPKPDTEELEELRKERDELEDAITSFFDRDITSAKTSLAQEMCIRGIKVRYMCEQLTRYREVMEQAVEALESCDIFEDLSGDMRQGFNVTKCKKALTALREALKEE